MTTENPTLFIKDGCPYCAAAMEYLDAKGVRYDPAEVSHDPDNMETLEDVSGQTKTPTLSAGDDVLADFDVEQLEPFLQQHGLL